MAYFDSTATQTEILLMLRLADMEEELANVTMQLEWAFDNLSPEAIEAGEQAIIEAWEKLPEELRKSK